ncbi:MAG: DUF3387 domain-containing protein [Bacteroidales bacterium]|nr:DUF3387 domain-containing protein [Bacteroidales bacterium]
MNVTDYMSGKVERFPKGNVFTYADFFTGVNKKEAVMKAINHMAASGKIAKLLKVKYYKPENTPFGNLQPNRTQVVKDILGENRIIISCLTDYSMKGFGYPPVEINEVFIEIFEQAENFKKSDHEPMHKLHVPIFIGARSNKSKCKPKLVKEYACPNVREDRKTI